MEIREVPAGAVKLSKMAWPFEHLQMEAGQGLSEICNGSERKTKHNS